MKKEVHCFLWVGLIATAVLIGCESSSDDGNGNEPGGESDPGGGTDTGSSPGGGTDTESETDTDVPCEERDGEITAVSADFDQGGGSTFFLSHPDSSAMPSDYFFSDNGTMATVDGRDCVLIHAKANDNSSYGYSVEFQIDLDARTDLSCQDFNISFDIYVPEETFVASEPTPAIQWAFFENAAFTPLYSSWFPSETGNQTFLSDTWTTVSAEITQETTGYDMFPNSPDDWQMDVVRVQLILDGAPAEEGAEVRFYVDNLVVKNF